MGVFGVEFCLGVCGIMGEFGGGFLSFGDFVLCYDFEFCDFLFGFSV